jgi:putative ABC transport system permease protein
LVSAVRTVLASLDKNLPVYNIETIDGYLSSSVAAKRFITLLLGLFAVLALVLATVGIYGVMAFSVCQRTRELGIRIVLGAQPSHVLRLVLERGILLTFLGTAIGIALAMGVTQFISSMLFDVHPDDPLTLAGVATLVTIVALLACYIPARRATAVDPIVALRCE